MVTFSIIIVLIILVILSTYLMKDKEMAASMRRFCKWGLLFYICIVMSVLLIYNVVSLWNSPTLDITPTELNTTPTNGCIINTLRR